MTTRKAYAAALLTALGSVLAATTPFLTGRASTVGYAALAALAALGVTWRVPNASTPEHGTPGTLTTVLDSVPAVLASPLSIVRGEAAADE